MVLMLTCFDVRLSLTSVDCVFWPLAAKFSSPADPSPTIQLEETLRSLGYPVESVRVNLHYNRGLIESLITTLIICCT